MTQKTWVLPLDQEGEISFPEDLMKVMEWEEGTILKWDMNEDGSISLRSVGQERDPHNPEQQDAI